MHDPSIAAALVYTGLVTTSLAIWLETIALEQVPAAEMRWAKSGEVVFVVFVLQRMGKKKFETYRTSTYFHTCRVSIPLNCSRNPALGSLPFSFRGSDNASDPYRRSPLLLQQRKLPFFADA